MHTRTYVPADFAPADWSRSEPIVRELTDRSLPDSAAVEKWLADYSEFAAALDEAYTRAYIDKSCHTDDPAIEAAFLHFVENVEPRMKEAANELQSKFLNASAAKALTGTRYDMLRKHWSVDVELFRQENVELEVQEQRIVNDYDKLMGTMTVEFRGKTYTPPQMARFLEEPDRETRREAWQALAGRRLAERERVDELFDALLPLRHRIAVNAGFADYRAYRFRKLHRFDYTAEDCERFGEAIERTCLPIIRDLEAKRRAELKVDALRPWDMNVDPMNRPPLRPFEASDIDGFVQKTTDVFARLSPDLAAEFDTLRQHGNLDLGSRPGKQPGGYQSSLEESKRPFIFMNAAGLQADVRTLLHEGGHAFHYLWAADREPLVFLRSAPIEFCEVASMGMELLGADHFDVFYGDAAEQARARRDQFEGVVKVLPWIATIDGFQHWLYTHPGHSRQEREAAWLSLVDRFGDRVDWTGHEATRASMWQRQLHLFGVPFYYVEYGIAQLGALQLWLKSRDDARAALSNYKAGLRLGGTEPLPKLFATAGLEFDFSDRTVGPLMSAVREELASLN